MLKNQLLKNEFADNLLLDPPGLPTGLPGGLPGRLPREPVRDWGLDWIMKR